MPPWRWGPALRDRSSDRPSRHGRVRPGPAGHGPAAPPPQQKAPASRETSGRGLEAAGSLSRVWPCMCPCVPPCGFVICVVSDHGLVGFRRVGQPVYLAAKV